VIREEAESRRSSGKKIIRTLREKEIIPSTSVRSLKRQNKSSANLLISEMHKTENEQLRKDL